MGVVPPVSLRHSVRCVTVAESGLTVEDVLMAVREEIWYKNISSASHMKKAVALFVKEEVPVSQWNCGKWRICRCFTICCSNN